MENKLAVKTVDFMGDELLAAQDKDGVIWTGINSFCQGIGLSKSQRDTQVQNIQSDEVLKMGCLKFQAGIFDPNNETLALQLDYVPLWLAKISITPNMKENNPELVEKLIKYQLKVKDALAQAFLPKRKSTRQKSIGQKEDIRFYNRNDSILLAIGQDIYELDPDDCFFVGKFETKLREMGINKISDILKAYVSVKFKKIECTSVISGNE